MEESSVNHIEENTEIRIPSLSDCNKEGHHKSKEEDTEIRIPSLSDCNEKEHHTRERRG